jgi:DNA repair exonuclease SbcCD ATPase subunit
LFREGKPLAYRHEADTQQAVEAALGVDFSGFISSTVFGGYEGGRKPFALLTDSERKRILDSFLRFEQFDSALERAKDRRVVAEKSLVAAQLEQRDLSGLIKGTKSNLEFLTHRVREQKLTEKEQIGKLRRRLRHLSLPEKVPASKLGKLEQQVQEKSVQLGQGVAEISLCRETLAQLKAQLHSRQRLIGRRCTACGQQIGEDSVQAFRKHVVSERQQWKTRLSKAKLAARQLEEEVAYGRSRLKRLQEKQKGYFRKIQERESLLKGLETRLAESGNSNAPFSIQHDLLATSYSKSLSRLLVLEQQQSRLEQWVKDYRFWEEGFGPRGVKALIIREILPTLNHKLAGYSREIFGDGTTIQLSATQETKTGEERELLNLQYNSPSGASSYIGESSGGRRRADLCVLLVFSWLARASNILFVDEMLDHLDAGGRERALSILQEQRGSVFIVTHERGLKSQLAKTWTVIKEHKASRVEFSP